MIFVHAPYFNQYFFRKVIRKTYVHVERGGLFLSVIFSLNRPN